MRLPDKDWVKQIHPKARCWTTWFNFVQIRVPGFFFWRNISSVHTTEEAAWADAAKQLGRKDVLK